MQPARHEVVARALGRARRENRRLELEKPLRLHPLPDARDDARPQHDVRVRLLAAQIEKAVAQALLFGNLLRAGHLERQRLGRPTARRAVRRPPRRGRSASAGLTFSASRPTTRARHADDASRARGVDAASNAARLRREHALRDAVVIAQIDEQQMAVVALAMDPAGQPDRLADVVGAQHPAGVRAVRVRLVRRSLERPLTNPGVRSAALATCARPRRARGTVVWRRGPHVLDRHRAVAALVLAGQRRRPDTAATTAYLNCLPGLVGLRDTRPRAGRRAAVRPASARASARDASSQSATITSAGADASRRGKHAALGHDDDDPFEAEREPAGRHLAAEEHADRGCRTARRRRGCRRDRARRSP